MVNNTLHRKLNIENYVSLYIPRVTPGTLGRQTIRAPIAAHVNSHGEIILIPSQPVIALSGDPTGARTH